MYVLSFVTARNHYGHFTTMRIKLNLWFRSNDLISCQQRFSRSGKDDYIIILEETKN